MCLSSSILPEASLKAAKIREFLETELGVKLPEPNAAGEIAIACPFHRDSKPSMSINTNKDLYKCFSCGSAGSVYDFYMDLHGCDFETAKAAIDKGELLPTVSEDEVEEWHDELLANDKMLRWLEEVRGIKKTTVKRFQLGWDGRRITIPIRDTAKRVVNVRRYDPQGKGSNKVISYDVGYGAARLFPLQSFEKSKVVLVEGEMDCLLANQMGIPAVTSTGGAGTWKQTWNKFFFGKDVYICYDRDQQGVNGAAKAAKSISRFAHKVFIVELPISEIREQGGEDFTDYVMKYHHGINDFKRVLKSAKEYGVKEIERSDEPPVALHLSEASKETYYGKRISVNAIVAGKDLAPFLVPKKVLLTCEGDGGKKCNTCALMGSSGSYNLQFDSLNPILLELIDCPSGQQKGIIKQEAGIPGNCKDFEFSVVEAYNIEEIYLMPEIDFSSQDSEYVIRRAFYVGHGISTNKTYTFTGVTIPEPHRQYATHLLDSAVPAQDDVGVFSMTPEVKERLASFRPHVGQSVADKLNEIHSDFTSNVTHIYGRNELLMAFDLVYHSVISFDFQNKRIIKGWNEVLVVGDTRTGKSESLLTLMNHYRAGELVTGENTSFAGLVGGMQQNQKRWSITWGKIPLNDRRLIGLDECGSLTEDSISRMSGIRSSGVAEITKIQTERTHARTRMIWMGNPRNGKSLNNFAFGVNAIRELIGAPEDIARFDLALACSTDDVPMEVINAEFNQHDRVEHEYTTELCNELIRWVWSRSPEQVRFGRGVEAAILQLAMEQGRTYSNRIPLVEAANQRIKIAKMAIAVAARLFSTDKTGECILVKKEHVEFVGQFIEQVYKMRSLGYWEFSRQQFQNVSVAKEHREDVYKLMAGDEDLANIFLTYSYVRIKDLEDMLDCEREEAKHYLKVLVKAKMLFKTSNGFTKSPAFTELLRELQSESISRGEA